MSHNPALSALAANGVSIWLDDLSRERLDSGNLASLIAERGVVGVTTNPSIFQAALSKGEAYAADLAELARSGAEVSAAVTRLTTDDVRQACDLFEPVYRASHGADGRVSIEVDPRLAHDTDATVAQARQLWSLVDRPNLLIKIPATREGLPAITTVLTDGICVNVTLIFSLDRYRGVMHAYLDGLEAARAAGHDLSTIHSVASFFVSRVDSEVDRRLDALGTPPAAELRGKAAIANAVLAYEAFEEVFSTPRWSSLEAAGAHAQRPLWASTGVKDPAYDDTRYVVELVAPGTVNTMPEKTLDALADHGEVRGDTIHAAYDWARGVLDDLDALGISYTDVTDLLEAEGVEKFEKSWNELLDQVGTELDRYRS